MKSHPILFSAPMVHAILEGQKTQTRRVVRKQFPNDAEPAEVSATSPEGWQISGHSGLWWDDAGACIDDAIRCPFGIPGDRLWAREAWHAARDLDRTPPRDISPDSDIEYAATARSYAEIGLKGKCRPGMFMPRWASRITLEIVSVRVERLNEISGKDCIAEGIDEASAPDYIFGLHEAYRDLWESINGPESWAANPWVWVVEFKRIGQ